MPVTDVDPKIRYAGDGSTVTFTYPFRIFEDTDLEVVLVASNGTETILTYSTEYTVTGAGDLTGGEITLVTAPAADEELVISRELAVKRDTDYAENGKLKSQTLDNDLDRITMLVQQNAELISRALLFSKSSNLENLFFPDAEADTLLGWNGGGTAIENKAPSGAPTVVTYIDDVTDFSGIAAGINVAFVRDELRGGWFNRIPSETTDGGTIFDGDGYSWKRQYQGPVNVLWFGAADDGSTDNSDLILTIAGYGFTEIVIPYNVKFNKVTVAESLPETVVLYDLSQINDFSASGETTKSIGDMESGTAANDLHRYIASGHHPVHNLNNLGTSDSESAKYLRATHAWSHGFLEEGATDKRGYRPIALNQWAKISTGNFWAWAIRKQAPWIAAVADYERWAAGVTIGTTYAIWTPGTAEVINNIRHYGTHYYKATSNGTTGSTPPTHTSGTASDGTVTWEYQGEYKGRYRQSGDNHYVAANVVTPTATGATAPTHTSGTVSDGAVDWTWISSSDTTVIAIDEYNRVQFGTGNFDVTHSIKVNVNDPGGGNFDAEWEATGTSKIARHKLIPTDSGGTASPQPYMQAQDGVGLRIMDSAGSTNLVNFSDDNGTELKHFTKQFTGISNGDTSPDVTGKNVIYTNNTGATSITHFDGGSVQQEITIVAVDNNTTLLHNDGTSTTNLRLTGSANLAMGVLDTVTFLKVPSGISGAGYWIETARSIK